MKRGKGKRAHGSLEARVQQLTADVACSDSEGRVEDVVGAKQCVVNQVYYVVLKN
jgi:hypothetical protein